MKRILLADDDVDDRLLFEEVFNDLPRDQYQLFSVGNGEEVMSFLNGHNGASQFPDLIILDQNMPLMSGKDTLLALKASEKYKDIPVIIYSTYNEKSFIRECNEIGVLAVVSKPDSFEGYIQMINNFLKYLN
jgi:CheY-like chemotaxis protein